MNDAAHLESTLEKIIVEHLSEHGWYEGVKSNLDLTYGLDPTEIELFILETQPEASTPSKN